jgi:glycosyltransferase involved in cell wall biosynthesis
MSPLISILIPAYNSKRWIRDSILSALNQTWLNKEIIVVDDGSTDNTLKIAKSYESERLKVVTQKNRGAAAARNSALSLAQGDYIQWLDADDLLAPDKISKQLQDPATEDPKVLLSSAFGLFYRHPQQAVFSPNLLWNDLSPSDWIVAKFANNLWLNPAVWLVSRELTEAAGNWNENLSLDDDGEYFCRVVAKSRFVKFLPTAKSYYRQWSSGSLSRTSSKKACRSLLNSLKLSIGYLLALEDSHRTRSAALSYLQIWMTYFYPNEKDLLQELYKMANSLGGVLLPPKLQRKYEFIRLFLGWDGVYTTMRAVSRSKLWFQKALDELNWTLSRTGGPDPTK